MHGVTRACCTGCMGLHGVAGLVGAHGIAHHGRGELHALPLLYALGLAWEPEEGTAQLLHHGEHRATGLPPKHNGLTLGGELHAVDEPVGVITRSLTRRGLQHAVRRYGKRRSKAL